jgi:hypothetical protein
MKHLYANKLIQLHKWCSIFSFVFISNIYLNAQIFSNVTSSVNIQGVANGQYGNGISFYDWNTDGLDDVVLTSDSIPPIFYENIGGTFEAVQFPGISVNNQVKSVCWVDINNDYAPDIAFNVSNGSFKLFLNDGNFEFTDISVSSGIDQTLSQGYGQSWGDYNNDGYLDLFISNYQTTNEFPLRSNYLYRNNGDNTFTNVTDLAGISNAIETTFLSVWFDVNLDGYSDLYILNDRNSYPNYLYLNNTDGTFTDISESSGLREFFEPMSGTVGDYNHDGLLDVYVTDALSNRLYRNNGDLTFTNVAAEFNLQMNKACWGASWVDVDNNAWEDLIVATASPLLNYSDLWLFSNSQGNFDVNQTGAIPINFDQSFAIATGDIDDNGSQDILCHSLSPTGTKIYSNNLTQSNYIKIRLEGTVSNTNGIGALIKLYAANTVQTKYMMCGDQYLSQNSQWLHFGIRNETSVDSIIINWPSGIIDKHYDVPANQSTRLREGSAIVCSISIENKASLCPGDSAILDAGIWDSYLWPDGSTDRYYSVTQSGTYTVQVTLFENTIQSEPIEVLFQETENIDLTFENTPCFGSSFGMLSSVSNAAGPVETIFFNSTESNLPIEYLGQGAYPFYLFGSNGCRIFDTLNITQPQEISAEISFNISDSSEICEGFINGNSSVSGGTPPYAIEWRFYLENEIIPFEIISGESFSCVNFSENTRIQFRLVDANGCPVILEEILIPNTKYNVIKQPIIKIQPNPFHQSFELNLNQESEINIFDLSGKCVFSTNKNAGLNNIAPNNLAPGMYILNIYNNLINQNSSLIKID